MLDWLESHGLADFEILQIARFKRQKSVGQFPGIVIANAENDAGGHAAQRAQRCRAALTSHLDG